jgi:tyrosine-protein kinase Etk/Wzc
MPSYPENGNQKNQRYEPDFRPNQFETFEEEDLSVTFYNYLRALSRGKWIILVAFLTILGITLIISLNQKDIYEGITSVLINDQSSANSVVVSFATTTDNKINNEIEVLKSRSMAEQVAYSLINKVYKDPYKKGDTLEILFDKETGQIGDIDFIAAKIQDKLEVENLKNTDFLLLKFRAFDPDEAATISKTIAEVYEERNKKSTRNTARTVRQFLEEQLSQKRRLLLDSEAQLQRFMEQNRVVSLESEGTELIKRFSDFKAKADEAEVMLNILRSSLKAYNEEMRSMIPKLSNSAVQATITPYTELFQQQIAQLEVERDKILTDPGSDYNINVQERLQEYNDKIESYKKRLQQTFERQVKQGLSNVNNPDSYQDIYKKKLDLELELVSVETQYNAYKKIVEEYDAAFLKTPGINVEFARLERKAKSAEELYQLLEKRYQEALIAEEQVPKNIEVIDWAVPVEEPVAPNRLLNILVGIVAGVGVGFGVVMLIQFLDRTIYTPEQAEKLGPLLATIPVIESFEENVRNKTGGSVKVIEGADSEFKKIASHLVTHFDPKSTVSEAYRTLRTNILFSGVQVSDSDKKEGKIFVVTSSSPKEGKSTTISNLAITIAQGGQKVLLVDTDLRRPVVHSIFGFNKEPGLTNYLVGRAQFDDIVRHSPIDNLDIITSGTIPPNPSELIGTQKMKEFLAEIRSRYDIVLHDSPPVIAVTDPQVLSKMTDGVIIVISSGQTQIELAERAVESIKKVNSTIVGFVLNNLDVQNTYGSYYKYYRYYNYYYESKDGHDFKPSFLDKLFTKVLGEKN